MNKIKPFFNGSKNEDVPECYNRVRYMRESCKVFSDLWKTDKDFLNKSVDNDISKAFKEFRSSDIARGYRSPFVSNGPPSILNSTIDDLIQIHEYIDGKRKEWIDKFRTISEQAKEKQLNIRQTILEPRENYERAVRKLETAESNLKKFQNRSDRTTLQNYEERYRELEDIRLECDQGRTIARDIYATERYRIASEEHYITRYFFAQYLFEEQTFYNDVQQYLANRILEVKRRLDDDKLAPAFRCDLSEHCLQRIRRPIAYPIETCIRLLQNSTREEGLFRIAPSQVKQRKLVAELDLQIIDEKAKLQDLGYDAHVPASTLKQYLRELPDCLLTQTLLPLWNEITSLSDETRVQRIGQLINQLPKVNYNNLCYLIRFLSRIVQYSSENKMTANNLGICIGCSLLYPKEQSSNSYTNSSTIVELMIIHHKQFFPDQNEQHSQISYQPQPDLIPTHFQSKYLSNSNENLLDLQTLTDISQPSPRLSAKHRAPPPPPLSRGLGVQIEPTNIGQTSTEQLLFDTITAGSSPPINVIEKDRQVSVNSGIVLGRSQNRRKLSTSTREQENNSSKEENDLLSMSPTSNDGVHLNRYLPDLNLRMNNSNINSGQTNSIRTSNSSRRDNITISHGEITQF